MKLKKEGLRVPTAMLVTFLLVLVVVTRFDAVFYSLQSWSVVTALIAAMFAGILAGQRRVRVSFIALIAAAIVAFVGIKIDGLMLLAALSSVTALAALSACGAGLLFEADSLPEQS